MRHFPLWWTADGRCACPKGNQCTSPGKHPLTPNGFEDASCDEGQLTAWEQRWPLCHWGIATGAVSGIFVVDLDRKPGKDGVAEWERLQALHGQAPDTRMVETGSGGLHIYFQHPGGHVGNTQNKPARGIDVRGDGGYVVAPPSGHVSGGEYTLINDVPAAPCPAWLLKLFESSRVQITDSTAPAERGYFPAASPAVLEAARQALEDHGPAIQGHGGDAHTYQAAAILVHDFALTQDEALALFQDWNSDCNPPWSDRDLRAKLAGGAKYGTAPYGCKRGMDALQAGRKLLRDWEDGGSTEDGMFVLIDRARSLPFDDPAKRSVFEAELQAATGRGKTALALPKVIARAPARTVTPDALDFDSSASGVPHDTLNNALKVLERQDAKLWYDEFLQRVQVEDADGVHEWCDADDIAFTVRLQREMGLAKMATKIAGVAAMAYAYQHRRNCVRETLEALKWDGVQRCEDFLRHAYGAADNEYTRAASRNFWLSMAARALKPGCKVDNMLVLEGAQGMRKSSSLLLIAGGAQLFTEASESLHSKDFFVTLIGKLIVEIAEMDSFSRGEVAAVKRVLSCQVDRFRAPYERTARDWPRQGIFVGTTNRDDWARDDTGGRRFWPIVCTTVDLPYIEANREQLFAEAVSCVQSGSTWWEMPREATDLEQAARLPSDPWEGVIAAHLASVTETTVPDLMTGPIGIPTANQDKAAQMRVASVLRVLGWQRVDGWRDGQKQKFWARAA